MDSPVDTAERWLRCVDDYDKKGNLVRERHDPQTDLIRALLKEVKKWKS